MLRVQGLVRSFTRVRAQLQAGIAPSEAAAFRQQVRDVVAQVERLCREYQTRPEELPGPSRAAYQFLKELDLKRLPSRPEQPPSSSAGAAAGFRIKNLAHLEQYFATRMWARLEDLNTSGPLRAELQGEIARQATLVDGICAARGVTPAVLAEPTRQVYSWFTFLTDTDNLGLHLAALQRAKVELLDYEAAVQVHLIHMSSLWRVGRSAGGVVLKVSEGFLHADEAVWRALAQRVFLRRPQTPVLQAFAGSEDYTEVILELASFAAPATRGRVHDLDASFERVNRVYFDDSLPKPRLTWSKTPTVAKFGHYQPGGDIVMLSNSLDDPRVPARLVDLVMYHELLHKKLGVTMIGGRRQVHTNEFRAAERRFADFDAVDQQLEELAGRLRTPRD